MSVKWTNLPKGLKLVITTANGAAYPKIIGTPEALERWKPKLLEIQSGNPSTVAVEDTGVTFSSLMSIPNQVQMLTLFGTESGTIDVELSEILVDAGAVRWALASGWTTPEEASALLEAFEPPAPQHNAEPELHNLEDFEPPQEPVAAPEMDQPIEPLPESNPNPSVEPPEQSLPEAQPQPIQNDSLAPAEALTANDKRYSWVDLSAYGLRLVMSETRESYQAQGGAASLPTIEGSRSTIQAFKLRLDALGMAIVENEERIAAFYLDVDEIPALDVIQIQFPMAKLTEVSMADIERPLNSGLAQTPSIIDFDTVDFTPVQDALAKGLISRANMTLKGQTPSPITQSSLIDLASRYTGIAPEMFNRELTNYSNRQTQEILETSGVIAARHLTATALVNNEFSPELAEKLIEALVSDLPNMDVRSGDSQELMQYSTPLHMGLLVQQTLGITPDDQRSVWEPTMGNGALLTMVAPENISGIELDPKRVARLQSQGIKAVQGNAIDTTASEPRSKDIVVMNPPFGALPNEFKGGSKGLTYYSSLNADARIDIGRQDHWIALAHLEAMKDDGKAFIILGADSPMKHAPGEMSSKSNRFRQMIHDSYEVVGESWVSGNLYKQQGAAWPLHVIAIGGRRDALIESAISNTIPVVNNMDEFKQSLGQWKGFLADMDLDTPEAKAKGAARTRQGGERAEREDRDTEPSGSSEGNAEEPEAVEVEELPDTEVEESPPEIKEEPEEIVAEELPEIAEDLPLTAQLEAVEEEAEAPIIDVEDKMVPYEPASNLNSMKKLVPANLATSIRRTLNRLVKKHGDIDNFVATELGWTHEHLAESLGAEQIDAVAMAIDKAYEGRGIVLGDKTGVGKGRVIATMIAWGIKNNITPVFLTENVHLIADMARDLKDIGEFDLVNPIITNHGAIIKDQVTTEELWRAVSPSQFKDIYKQDGELGDNNAIFTTYSQINKTMDKCPKAQWLLRAAKGGIVIMDESHNAAGPTSNTGANMAAILDVAKSGMYVSATWAKNPQNMGIYAYKTSLAAGTSPQEVIETIIAGGVAAQEAAAAMLADGEYIARAHPMNHLPELKVIPEYSAKHDLDLRDIANKMSRVYDMFLFLSGQTAEVTQKENKLISEQIKKMPEGEREKAAGWSVDSINFASRMWLFEKLMNYITLSSHTVDLAIEEHKAGRKPFIAVDSTMEAFLEEIKEEALANASNAGANPSDALSVDASFQDYLLRYLPNLVSIKRVDRYGNVEEADMFDIDAMRHAWLNGNLPSGTDDSETRKIEKMAVNYFRTEELIKEIPDNLPISPIDWIRNELTKAGMTVAEGTGRTIGLDYSGDNQSAPVFYTRDSDDRNKALAISKYNNGEADVLIGNRSIFTGFSMHASKTFADQKNRTMIFLDPPLDPNKVIQAMGRIDRTGAVEGSRPYFTFLASPMPGAKRPVANLISKLASLYASTTGDRNVDMEALGEDLYNEVGDLAVLDVMLEREDGQRIMSKLNFDLKKEAEEQKGYKLAGANTGLARRLTGRMVALLVEQQEELYDQFENRFRENIQQLEAEGRNPLRSHVLDLRATTIETIMVEPATGSSSFQSGVNAELVEYEVPYHYVKPEAVHKTIDQTRALALKRGDSECKPLKPLIGEIAAKLVGQEVQRLKRLYPDEADWENKDSRAAFLKSLLKLDEKSRYPSKNHEAAVQIFQKNSNLFNKVESLVEKLTPGLIIKDYPLDNTRYSNSSTTLILAGIQPANMPSHLGSWGLRLYSNDPEVGVMNISLNQLVNSLGGDTGTYLEPEIASDEMIDMIFDSTDQEQRTFKAQRVILTGNLFKAHSKAASIKKGRIGAYTDKQGYKHLGVIMPSNMTIPELEMAVKSTTFPINDSKTAADYFRHLTSTRPNQSTLFSRQSYQATFEDSSNKHQSNDASSGVILQHHDKTGGVRILISGVKKYNQSLIKDKKLKEFVTGGDFETDAHNKKFMSAFLKSDKTVEELIAHLIKHHGMAFAGNPLDRDWYNDYMEVRVQVERDQEGLDIGDDDRVDDLLAEMQVDAAGNNAPAA